MTAAWSHNHKGEKMKKIIGLAFAAAASFSAYGQSAVLHLQYSSSAYSADIHEVYTPETAYTFSAYTYPLSLPSNQIGGVAFNMGVQGWTPIFFSTDKLGIPLQVGHYENVQLWSIATTGHAGFDIGYNNRGGELVGGSFDITELTLTPDGYIQTFAASFDVAMRDTSTYKGTFAYSISAPVPEPSTAAMMMLGFASLVSAIGVRNKVC